MTTPAAELARLVAEFEAAELREQPTLPRLDALEAAGAVAAAPALAGSPERAERLLAARVMELLPHESYLPALATLLRDPDPEVAAAARDAFAGQHRTSEWHRVSQYDLPPHAQSP